ncbi:cysteine hydrolase family protein [Mycoplasmopsis fermentans]|uniref:cysteine hydrolase family protein n=1 Tax=Mycoplasmopsis fermentans TaxID=2115 RepID=UPI0038CD901E
MKKYYKSVKPEEIYICGIDTDCCVQATAVNLFEKRIRPIVLSNYCASNGGPESHEAALKTLSRAIGKENIIQL